MGGLMALLAAMGFTLLVVLTHRGMIEKNPGTVWEINFVAIFTAILIFVVGILIAMLFGFPIMEELRSLTLPAVLFLILEGALGPLLATYFIIVSIAQVGASHSSVLRGGSNPLFATLLAVIFLNERPGLLGIIAVFIIVGGIFVVGYRGHTGTIALLEKTKIAGGIFALLGGLIFALSHVARGAALNYGATPNTGFFIGLLTAAITLLIICRIQSGTFSFYKNINRKSLFYYGISGLGVLIGSYALLTAFTLIPVWQAVAIRNTQPVLAIFFSWILLKEAENITLRLVLGAALVTIGVVILNIPTI
jgi:drug/metabolite transporter (DMT)-like permease